MDTRSIIWIVTIGSAILSTTFCSLLVASMMLLGNTYVAPRLLVGLASLVYLFITMLLLKKGLCIVSSWMLVSFYAAVATGILLFWSVNAPVGVLVLGFVVFLSATLLGIRYILPLTVAVALLLALIQTIHHAKIIDPQEEILMVPATFGDVATYAAIFGIFGLIAWLAGRQTQKNLQRALSAEEALIEEKGLLSSRLRERTRQLREAQLKEMRQLYYFAQLGQQTIYILHELANSLSILKLDLVSMRKSRAISNVEDSIAELDELIQHVRVQLRQDRASMKFNVAGKIGETVAQFGQRAIEHNVDIDVALEIPSKTQLSGDPVRFEQILKVLIKNALDSLAETAESDERVIAIGAQLKKNQLVISIRDTGPGIAGPKRKQLFRPHASSKKHGLGIGLFMVRQIVQGHFKGKISLKTGQPAEFLLKFPCGLNSQ